MFDPKLLLPRTEVGHCRAVLCASGTLVRLPGFREDARSLKWSLRHRVEHKRGSHRDHRTQNTWGLWASLYGYRFWGEMERLRNHCQDPTLQVTKEETSNRTHPNPQLTTWQ